MKARYLYSSTRVLCRLPGPAGGLRLRPVTELLRAECSPNRAAGAKRFAAQQFRMWARLDYSGWGNCWQMGGQFEPTLAYAIRVGGGVSVDPAPPAIGIVGGRPTGPTTRYTWTVPDSSCLLFRHLYRSA